MLSGEGPTDLGRLDPQGRFEPGPLAKAVSALVEPEWGYSPLDAGALVFVEKARLVDTGKALRSRRMSSFRGRNKPPDAHYFRRNARALAVLAKADAAKEGCPVGAVLFRDSDGTNSSPRSLWAAQVESMRQGFADEGFEAFGVPMIPRPKSEAWLLCRFQETPYCNCARFEELPGNDASPNSAKRLLEEARAVASDAEVVWDKVDMPSFAAFKSRLKEVTRAMAHAST